MDECGELRLESSGPRRFREALQPLCLVVATLGIPTLHSQTNPTTQPASLAAQVAAAKMDVPVQRRGANADAGSLDSAWHEGATTPGSTSKQADLAQRSASVQAAARDEVDAYKWDTGALQNDAFLVRANRDRSVLKIASRPAPEEERRGGAFKIVPEPAPVPDSAVESLLARMAQAAPAVPPGLSDTALGEPDLETERVPSTDAAAIESLLARMAAAVSPGPPAVGEDRPATANPAPDLTAASAPEPGDRVATPSAEFEPAEQGTTEPDRSSRTDAHEAASLVPTGVQPQPAGRAEPVAAASWSRPAKVLAAAEPRAEAAAPHAPEPVEPRATPAQTVPSAPLPIRTNKPAAAAPPSKPAPSSASAPAEGSLPRLAKSVAATLSKLRSNNLTSLIPGASAKPAPASSSLSSTNSLAASVPAGKPATARHPASTAPLPTAPPQPPTANLDPALFDKLRLRAIAAFGKRRAASINGRSIFQGEEAEFGVNGATLKVRCVEVKESSVVLQIAGMTGTVEVTMSERGQH